MPSPCDGSNGACFAPEKRALAHRHHDPWTLDDTTGSQQPPRREANRRSRAAVGRNFNPALKTSHTLSARAIRWTVTRQHFELEKPKRVEFIENPSVAMNPPPLVPYNPTDEMPDDGAFSGTAWGWCRPGLYNTKPTRAGVGFTSTGVGVAEVSGTGPAIAGLDPLRQGMTPVG